MSSNPLQNAPQVTIKDCNYGNVLHSTILTILGDEMTYNDLKHYAENPNNYSNLKVKYETYNYDNGRQHVSVWLDDKLVLEKITKEHLSCDMNYHLNQLEIEQMEEVSDKQNGDKKQDED